MMDVTEHSYGVLNLHKQINDILIDYYVSSIQLKVGWKSTPSDNKKTRKMILFTSFS
jgi:hypothetical protein